MGITGWHYAKSNKPDVERQIQHDLICEISKCRNSLKQREEMWFPGVGCEEMLIKKYKLSVLR